MIGINSSPDPTPSGHLQVKPKAYIALAISTLLLLLPLIVHLDGKPHADWQQFLGRFHILILHIPIGLLILLPILELANRYKPALDEAAALVLDLSWIACITALTLGYLLAYGSGASGTVVTHHMWGGILLTVCVALCILVRPLWGTGPPRLIYPTLLLVTLGVLSWAAHQGGTLTHGAGYLTDYMPSWLKAAVPAEAPKPKHAVAIDTFYTQHINPILDANCVSCHGESKIQGALRLDSYALLMKGGKDGAVVIPGDPGHSLLLTRITLPPNDKKFMPAEGKPALKPEDIALIRAWIQQGASPTAASLTGVAIEQKQDASAIQVGDYSALMPEIHQMAAGAGAKFAQVSANPADGLVLNTVDTPATFGDAQLKALTRFAPYTVEAELGRTAVTNASFDTLATFPHLRAIHLEGTAITGDGLSKLTQLSQLDYLNLSGTYVTNTSIAPLKSMKSLHHLYLYDTPAEPATAPPPIAPPPTAQPSPEHP